MTPQQATEKIRNNWKIFEDIYNELVSAEKKHPGWPTDPIHAAAILAEEAGELVQAAIDYTYAHGDPSRLKAEAVQVAAMAQRFLFNLDQYSIHQPKQAYDGDLIPPGDQSCRPK